MKLFSFLILYLISCFLFKILISIPRDCSNFRLVSHVQLKVRHAPSLNSILLTVRERELFMNLNYAMLIVLFRLRLIVSGLRSIKFQSIWISTGKSWTRDPVWSSSTAYKQICVSQLFPGQSFGLRELTIIRNHTKCTHLLMTKFRLVN